MGTALRQSAVGIVGIEHILPALVVLNPFSAEPAVQFLCRHAQLLGYLRGGVARDTFKHAVGVESLGQQPVDFHILLSDPSVLLFQEHFLLADEFVFLLQGGSQHLLCPSAYILLGVSLVGEDVSTMLADGRKHLSTYPVLEWLSHRFGGAHNQAIEVLLGDEGEVVHESYGLAMFVGEF